MAFCSTTTFTLIVNFTLLLFNFFKSQQAFAETNLFVNGQTSFIVVSTEQSMLFTQSDSVYWMHAVYFTIVELQQCK